MTKYILLDIDIFIDILDVALRSTKAELFKRYIKIAQLNHFMLLKGAVKKGTKEW